MRAIHADHHRPLFAFVGTDLGARRDIEIQSRQPQINYIATADFLNLMDLADFGKRFEDPLKDLGLAPFGIARA